MCRSRNSCDGRLAQCKNEEKKKKNEIHTYEKLRAPDDDPDTRSMEFSSSFSWIPSDVQVKLFQNIITLAAFKLCIVYEWTVRFIILFKWHRLHPPRNIDWKWCTTEWKAINAECSKSIVRLFGFWNWIRGIWDGAGMELRCHLITFRSVFVDSYR